jgi:ATP-binding cassette subfamily F protein 3
MSILSTTRVSVSYGSVDIFTDISVSVPRDARIAIVGPNGVGKTTLFRVLVGLEEPTDGRVFRAQGIKIGYLPQEAVLNGTHSLWDECLTVMSEVRAMEAELARLEGAMANPEQAEQVLERYGLLQEEFERRGGYVYETRIRTTLSGLGFSDNDYNRPLTQLSGGQRTRAFLARLLLSDPDLLVLDEPTNHLDIAAVEWLEGYLRLWNGSVVVVSHDRYFLDKVVDNIWEMGSEGLETYRGNYSAYLLQRQERWELRRKLYLSEMQRLEKEMDFIKRNIASQRVQMAKGKLRRLSREVEAIERLGFDALQSKSWLEITNLVKISDHPMGVAEAERRMRALRGPKTRPPRLNIDLKNGLRSGDLVLRTRELEIGYADEGRPLFTAPDLLLKRGECAAVIGPNGAGKTTFLKTLLQRIPPLAGEVILGASLNIGYFAQAHEDLDPNRTLMAEIETAAPNMLQAEVRNYLARFSFTRDEVFKQVSTLSGGERGRLALAKLSLGNANLLLLDEPTNHLDIPSQEILQEVLAQYQGTILLVSHDRYLIDALGTHIWEIEPDEAHLRVFEGTYSEYRAQEVVQQAVKQESARERYLVDKRSAARSSTAERKRRARMQEIEGLITDLDAQLASIGTKLENPPPDQVQIEKLGRQYVQVQEELEVLWEEWGELHD